MEHPMQPVLDSIIALALTIDSLTYALDPCAKDLFTRKCVGKSFASRKSTQDLTSPSISLFLFWREIRKELF